MEKIKLSKYKKKGKQGIQDKSWETRFNKVVIMKGIDNSDIQRNNEANLFNKLRHF